VQSIHPNASAFLRAASSPRIKVSAATLAELAAQIVNWDDVIRGASQHGILPLLYARLVEISDSIPSDVLEHARREFEHNAFHCITNAEELLQVLSAFEAARIDALPFKGVVLGAHAYGDMTLRKAGDLDLLIRFRDLRRATEILKQRGYHLKTKTLADGSPEAEDYFEFHFERPADGMVLELRWRLELTQPRYRHELGLEWVWPRRTIVKLAGAQVPDLDPVSSLLILCMHGSKHAWSRWMWICDVAMLIENEPALNWDLALREAKRVGLHRCLALGVLLACRGAGATVPQHVLERFENDRNMRKLSDFLFENVLEHPGAIPEGRLPYNIRILGFRDRFQSLLSPSILKPNELDRAAIRLPKLLTPLYYLVRPIRVLLDRSPR